MDAWMDGLIDLTCCACVCLW
jgi:hypothetical protein